MKKLILFPVFMLVFFSCKKEEKDDSYKYLYDKLDEFILREKNTLDGVYYSEYYKIKDNVKERKRYDSLYKISSSIDEKLKKLDFSDHKKALKFRDSTAKIFKIPLKFLKEDENKILNDSVFKKMMEIKILHLRASFHFLRIYPRKEPL